MVGIWNESDELLWGRGNDLHVVPNGIRRLRTSSAKLFSSICHNWQNVLMNRAWERRGHQRLVRNATQAFQARPPRRRSTDSLSRVGSPRCEFSRGLPATRYHAPNAHDSQVCAGIRQFLGDSGEGWRRHGSCCRSRLISSVSAGGHKPCRSCRHTILHAFSSQVGFAILVRGTVPQIPGEG